MQNPYGAEKKHQPKLAMKSKGTEKAFHLSQCSLGRQGWKGGVGGDVAALSVREASAAKLSERHVVFRA